MWECRKNKSGVKVAEKLNKYYFNSSKLMSCSILKNEKNIKVKTYK